MIDKDKIGLKEVLYLVIEVRIYIHKKKIG